MTFFVRNAIKDFYYFSRLDLLRQFLSIDLYKYKNFLFGNRIDANDLYEIDLLSKTYKQQVYVVAATEDYIKLFLPGLIRQLRKSESLVNTDFLVGIITNGKSRIDVDMILKRDFPSVEFVKIKSKFSHISSTKNCARFFLTQKILEKHNNLKILITDIDVQINRRLDELFSEHNNYNGIKLRGAG